MKRFAFAGASSRAVGMYALPIVQHFSQSAQCVGVFDTNPIRANLLSQSVGDIPVFADFEQMLVESRPDCVIVTTIDRYHHEYIIRSLEAGCDVITEKPMTIDAEKCRDILAAEKRSGKQVIVTFNYRFTPHNTRVKELLRSGIIGEVTSIDFEWLLDRKHGADYFRRWHRRKENSGGLLVHKATHHFDMINWWLEDEPRTVFALGSRRFYGPTRSERGERCSTCQFTQSCEFFVDFASNPNLKALYFDAESADGYYRDRCVFADEIDIEDTMSVTVGYDRGTQLAYSLFAFSPYEGWRAAINGLQGRIELQVFESGPQAGAPTERILVYDVKGNCSVHEIDKAVGGHGGGDARLLERLFGGQEIADPLGYMAGSWAGAMSIMIGIAGNQSIASGQVTQIKDLL